MKIILTIILLISALYIQAQIHHSDTLHIYYQLDQASLAPKSKLILDE